MSINVCNNNSMSAITSLPSGVGGGSLVLIATQTASSSSTISFTSGIDSTYKEYIFKFISCHPATDNVDFLVNFSADGGSNYNVTKTTTFFAAYENESGGSGTLTYAAANDLAQSTDFQMLNDGVGNGNDETCVGTLHLFDPSNTTFVKHFMATSHRYYYSDYAIVDYLAGYCNTTSAIDGIQFNCSSGNIDSGIFKLYGIKGS